MAILWGFTISDFFVMKKTEESIRRKWEQKTLEMEIKKNKQTKYDIEKWREKLYHAKEVEFEKRKQKLERKSQAYINRKTQEYKRKMINEIRELQGKPKRQYKSKQLTSNQKLQIALAILQENCRLRDTDKNWFWFCVSCGRWCTWEELAWWHRFSRKYISICLRPENVNAQCHKCNWITWPKGNLKEKEKVNNFYKATIISKYGDQIVAEMEEHVKNEIKNPHKYRVSGPYLDELVPELIKENGELWAKKSPNFLLTHKPAKNRQKVYEKYRNLSNN